MITVSAPPVVTCREPGGIVTPMSFDFNGVVVVVVVGVGYEV